MSSAGTSHYRRPVDAAALANNLRVFADADCATEPLYAALGRGLADEPAVLDLLMQAPYPQRRPVLLFAAVHDLLLGGARHALADFYRSVVGTSARDDVVHATAAFVGFCAVERDALLELLTTRATQTNEVGRCAGLRLALAGLAADRPIALIDVGCSAGLNLLVDRYRYEYAHADGSIAYAGPDSEVVVQAALVGAEPCAVAALPPLAGRFGIDLAPLSVADERDARWLRACVWPGDDARHARLGAAIALARTTPLDLHRGDAAERLPGILATIAPGVRPVVFHSWVVSYFDQPAKRRFVDAMQALVRERDAVWISAEGPGVVPCLPTPPLEAGAPADRREATLWHATRRENRSDTTRVVTRVVARSHPHGRWIEPLP